MTLEHIHWKDGTIDLVDDTRIDSYLQGHITQDILPHLDKVITELNKSSVDCIIYDGIVTIDPIVSSFYLMDEGFSIFPKIKDAELRTVPFFSYGEGYATTIKRIPHLCIAYLGGHDPNMQPQLTKEMQGTKAPQLYESVLKELEDAVLYCPNGKKSKIHATNLHSFSNASKAILTF